MAKPSIRIDVPEDNEESKPLLASSVHSSSMSNTSSPERAPATPFPNSARSTRPAHTPKSFSRSSSRSCSDISVLCKLKDIDFIQEHYPRLDTSEVADAADSLDGLVAVSTQTGVVCSKGLKDYRLDNSYRNAIMFKRRPMSGCTVLHFAIWFVAEFGVDADLIQQVLDSLSDPDDVCLPASYAAGPRTVFLTAQHLAAGLGQYEILKILARHASTKVSDAKLVTVEEYVCQWAKITEPHSPLTGADYLDHSKDHAFTNFYQAIHDSTFGGYGDVTLWLLRHKAECSRQMQGITPLHFLAFIGISGVLEERVGDHLKQIVKALTECGRKGENVTALADMHNFIPGGDALTPLEIAVEDASRFPQEHLGLLAPCLADGSGLTYFDDIKRIADVTADGALNLVRTIAEKGRKNQHILRRFRVNAQMAGTSDVLASIFYTAPLAASEMLELLEVDAEVEDTAHHSIPARTDMRGWLGSLPMRCTYQVEAVTKDCLLVPHWEWKTRNVRTTEDTSWHNDFIPRPPRLARNNYIKNVRVVACLLPNILDIDVFMAFAHCQKEHLATMSKKTVQGAIFCLWSNLIEKIWAVDAAYRFFDVVGYVALGMLIPSSEGRISLAWTVVAGGALYQLALSIMTAKAVCKKWAHAEDATMASMWSPWSPFAWNAIAFAAVQALITIGFAIDLSFQKGDRRQFDDRLLALCLILACFRFIYTWRLSSIGSTIYTISETFFAGAVNQMLFITCMLLLSTVAALMVLTRLHTVGLAVSAYRGFLFGDDYGFNDMGMDVGHESALASGHDGVLLCATVFGAFFFNVIVLNIIIAVYGHEYEKNQFHTPAHFTMGRADYCVKSVLSCYIVEWRGQAFNRAMIASSFAVMIVSILLGLSRAHIQIWEMWLSAFLFATGQVGLRVALIQCDWFGPEGQDADDHQRFLWICHSREWQQTTLVNTSIEDRIATLQDHVDDEISSVQRTLSDLDDKVSDLMDAFTGSSVKAGKTSKTPRAATPTTPSNRGVS